MLKGKKILLGITGSIAAYKAIYLVRLLVKAGAEVRIILTPAAREFVSTLTLSTLSRNMVITDLFDDQGWSNHVMLGRWADLMLIAPLSCNTLAKMANGNCDNMLLATYLSVNCPVVVAPAMDEDMWNHPATKINIEKIISFGNHIIPVESGELASGLVGPGRMAEPEQIMNFISSRFFLTGPLNGKKALVTAGPTYEPIDPVRFIGNHSSGKMGIAIAHELKTRGADTTLVLGPVSIPVLAGGLNLIRVNTAEEMNKVCREQFENTDIAVMSAAIADYTPVAPAGKKIKKSGDNLSLELRQTTDILASLGSMKKKGQVLVGFALETDHEKANALKKLKEKNADLMVMNSLNDKGSGFGTDTNRITIFRKDGKEFEFETKLKTAVAKDIVDAIINLYEA